MKPIWCKYFAQRRQPHSGFHFRFFYLKDSKDELILIVSGIFIVNFEHISYLFLVFLLLTLNK